MLRRLFWLILLVLVMRVGFAAKQIDGPRVALVIGNEDYERVPLQNPVNDAIAIEKALRELKFKVIPVRNAKTLGEMEAAMKAFIAKLRNRHAVGLFYFAGHGKEFDGDNYLLPTQNHNITTRTEHRDRALNASVVREQMQEAGTELSMIILDACRTSPGAREDGGEGSGLAATLARSDDNPEQQALIAFAAAPKNVAIDVGKTAHSLYTQALLDNLATPSTKVEDMFKRVRKQVIRKSKEYLEKPQKPWLNYEMTDEFCFKSCPTVVTDADETVVEQTEPATKKQATAKPGPSCGDCPEMVKIPGGTFMMGAQAGEKDAQVDEKLRHSVILDAFRLSKYEVSRAEFAAFVGETGYAGGNTCFTYGEGKWAVVNGRNWKNPGFAQEDSHPVVCVSLEDAQAYIGWLNRKTGQQYRLPTEAEWEYAARGGTDTARFWGDEEQGACRFANLADQTLAQDGWNGTFFSCSDGFVYTAPVGSFDPNRFGLYDMLGNVWEWTCSDDTDKYDGREQTCGNGSRWVYRGGSWHGRPAFVRAALRLRDVATSRSGNLGFRLAQD